MVYWTSMDGPEVEHRVEIRREGRATPLWIGVAVLAAIVAVVLGGRDGDATAGGERSPGTAPAPAPTSETPTTGAPPAPPPVLGVARGGEGGGALVPVSSAGPGPVLTGGGPSSVSDGSRPVATTGRVAVLADDGTLHAGSPGETFAVVACCVDELVPSNEPHHVWVRSGDEVALVDLDGGPTGVRLPLDGDAVVGPASFGLVTVGDDGTVRWRRPSFDPVDLPTPHDRQVLDSGGEMVLTGSLAAPGRARYELWSIVEGVLVQAHDVALPDGSSIGGVLAADGSAVALRARGGWQVHARADGALLDVLPHLGEPVWVGGAHFAVLAGRQLIVSELDPPLPGHAFVLLAEQSP